MEGVGGKKNTEETILKVKKTSKLVGRSWFLLLGNVLKPICGPIVFIRNLSIFSFSLGFSKTYMRFTAYMRAYCFYTKATNFLVFCGFFKKRKASGVSLGSRGQGYELNMFENGRKDGHIGGARRLIPLLLC